MHTVIGMIALSPAGHSPICRSAHAPRRAATGSLEAHGPPHAAINDSGTPTKPRGAARSCACSSKTPASAGRRGQSVRWFRSAAHAYPQNTFVFAKSHQTTENKARPSKSKPTRNPPKPTRNPPAATHNPPKSHRNPPRIHISATPAQPFVRLAPNPARWPPRSGFLAPSATRFRLERVFLQDEATEVTDNNRPPAKITPLFTHFEPTPEAFEPSLTTSRTHHFHPVSAFICNHLRLNCLPPRATGRP
jgi:hypothetical protein